MKRNEDASLMKERERENESGANISEAQQNAGFSLHKHPRHADRFLRNGEEKEQREQTLFRQAPGRGAFFLSAVENSGLIK